MTKAPRIYKLTLCYITLLQIVLGVASEAFGAAARDPGNRGAPEALRRNGAPNSGDLSHSREQFTPLTGRTNVNSVTDFFDRNIKDKGNLESNIEQSKQGNIGRLDAISELPGGDRAEAEAGRLSGISAHELESAGLRERGSERCTFYDQNGFEINRADPLIIQHKKEMDKVAEDTENKLHTLLAGLKNIGIDCQTVAGNMEQEPEYYITLEQEAKLDTVYDKTYCEQPHHTYSCNYVLTTTCIRPDIAYKPWQAREIRIPGGELISSGRNLFETQKPRDKVFEYVLNLKPVHKRGPWGLALVHPNPYKVQLMREFLVTKHPGATLNNIDAEVDGRAEGHTFSIEGWNYCGRRLGSKDYAFSTYVVNYRYREGYPICHQWQDTWREQCKVD